MFELSAVDISHWVSRYLYPFVRIAGLLMVMPLIGSRMLNMRVRLLLAVTITLVVVPMLPPLPHVEAISMESFIIILQQLLIGIALGFVLELVMQVFVITGQLIAMQTGLGIATTVDPSQGASVVVISSWLQFMVGLVFLSLNGHLVAIEILIDSFRTLPVGTNGLTADTFSMIVLWSSWMLSAAVLMALPALTALLIVNLAFGVMTRAAPQLNIFALGFPVTMVVGLFILWISMGGIAEGFQAHMDTMFEFMKKLTGMP